VGSGRAYWIDGGQVDRSGWVRSSLLTVPLEGGPTATLASWLTSDSSCGPNDGLVALDSQSVYWSYNGPEGSVVTKVPLGGGTLSTVATAPTMANPESLAVSDGSLYWSLGEGSIFRVPTSGGVLSTLNTAQGNPIGLAIDSTSLYFPGGAGPDEILRMPLGGGAASTIARTTSMVFDTEEVLALTDSNVFWLGTMISFPPPSEQDASSSVSFAVMCVAKTGGVPAVLASDIVMDGNASGGPALAADATSVYFAEIASSSATIVKLELQ
jgi:hypothetical protein